MELSPPLQDCLNHLFRCYRENSNDSYDISAVARRHDSDPLAIAAQLKTLGYIRDDAQIDGDKVNCSISVEGIRRIDMNYLEEKIRQVVKGLGHPNSISNVAALLKLDDEHFQESFDIANEMQNRDLVKLLYAFQPKNMVNVEVTRRILDF